MPKNTPKDPKKKRVAKKAEAPKHVPLIVRQPDAEESELIRQFNAEFLKIHYEPEHEDGVTCWCGPESKIVLGQHYINHKEQRVLLRRLFIEFITKYSSLIAAREGKL